MNKAIEFFIGEEMRLVQSVYRFFFGGAMVEGSPTFGVGQSVTSRLGVVARLIEQQAVGKARLTVLEVGSYEGGSALALSAAIALRCEHGGTVTCVDPWQPYLLEADIGSNDTCHQMQAALQDGTVFERFCVNIKHAHGKAPISFHVGTLKSAVMVCVVIDEQFDLIYIDGSHAYQDVRNDIRLAKPLLKVGGVMCGDDLERQLHEVDREFAVRNKHREFTGGYHPGVTLAVGRAFGKVWCEDAVWAVKKLDRSGNHWSSP